MTLTEHLLYGDFYYKDCLCAPIPWWYELIYLFVFFIGWNLPGARLMTQWNIHVEGVHFMGEVTFWKRITTRSVCSSVLQRWCQQIHQVLIYLIIYQTCCLPTWRGGCPAVLVHRSDPDSSCRMDVWHLCILIFAHCTHSLYGAHVHILVWLRHNSNSSYMKTFFAINLLLILILIWSQCV